MERIEADGTEMKCFLCGEPLLDSLKTFGPIGREMCWNCWSVVGEGVTGSYGVLDGVDWDRVFLEVELPNSDRREIALDAISSANSIEISSALRQLVQTCKQSDTLYYAARALARLDESRALPYLLLAVERMWREWPKIEAEHLLEDTAILTGQGGTKIVNLLAKQLQSPDPISREVGVLFWEFVAPTAGIKKLLTLLETDTNANVRCRTLNVLGNLLMSPELNSSSVIYGALIRAYYDADKDVHATAKKIIGWQVEIYKHFRI